MAGTVGAIFNGALQFGSAIGLAALYSIKMSVEATHDGTQEYNGRTAAFLFVLAVLLVEILFVSYFYRRSAGCTSQPETEAETGDHDNNNNAPEPKVSHA